MKVKIILGYLISHLILSFVQAQSIELNKWVQSLPEDQKTLIKKEETPTHYFAFFHLTNNVLGAYSCDSKRAMERMKIGKSISKTNAGYNGDLTDKKGNSVIDEEVAATELGNVLKEKAMKLSTGSDFLYVIYFPVKKDFRGVMKHLYHEEVTYQGETEKITFEWQTVLSWVP